MRGEPNGYATYRIRILWRDPERTKDVTVRARISPKRVDCGVRVFDRATGRRVHGSWHEKYAWLIAYALDGQPEVVIDAGGGPQAVATEPHDAGRSQSEGGK